MATLERLSTVPLHSLPPASQDKSPLFARIPPEIRSEIFALVLTDFPDPSPATRYAAETCYTRPSYFSPRRSDTRLLRTCRAVYREAWFLPFVLREQTHWLTHAERAPPEYRLGPQIEALAATLQRIAAHHGTAHVEVRALRVFAQMWALEEGYLANLLRAAPLLHPRQLTLTIRHADWWWWESDEPLRFEGGWIGRVCQVLPPSVRELRIELESVVRKREQVDEIARQMAERWFFRRTDGVTLFADASGKANTVDSWTGPSTFSGRRWTRDEARPGEVDFYLLSVVFRPLRVVERRGGQVSLSASAAAAADWDFFKSVTSARKLRLRCVRPSPALHGDGADHAQEDEDGWNEDEEDDWEGENLDQEDQSDEDV